MKLTIRVMNNKLGLFYFLSLLFSLLFYFLVFIFIIYNRVVTSIKVIVIIT